MINPHRHPSCASVVLFALGALVSGCATAHSHATATTPERAPAASADTPSPAVTCAPPTEEMWELVLRLDDDYDEAHSDITLSVTALSELGIPGARAVLEQLDSDEEVTRLHAQRVLEGVLLRHYGWRPGRGYAAQLREEFALRVQTQIGYAYDADGAERQLGVERWGRWLVGPDQAPTDDVALTQEMLAAIHAMLPALSGCGEPVDLRVSFGRRGRVESVSGPLDSDSYRACLAAAVTEIRVRPFDHDSLWVHYHPDAMPGLNQAE